MKTQLILCLLVIILQPHPRALRRMLGYSPTRLGYSQHDRNTPEAITAVKVNNQSSHTSIFQ